MNYKKILYLLLLLIVSESYSQQSLHALGPWHVTSLSGNVGIKGHYRQMKYILPDFTNYYNNPFISGNLALNTNSYIWHPNFLKIDIGARYNPGFDSRNYLVTPNQSEKRTGSQLNLKATLFSSKPMSLSGYLKLNSSLANREYVNSYKTNSNIWGINYGFRNKIVPLKINYSSSKWHQEEIETGRYFENITENLEAILNKKIGQRDDNEFMMSQSRYYRLFQNDQSTNFDIINMRLKNSVFFDAGKKYAWRSFISNRDQKGSLSQQILRVTESVSLQLPYRFRLNGSYNYAAHTRELQHITNNAVRGNLTHQLYSSLNTRLNYSYLKSNYDTFDRLENNFGIHLFYKKDIPKGKLYITYGYSKQLQQRTGKTDFINIIEELHVVNDGDIEILDNPFVEEASIIVKDSTGLIVYQLNFDYLIVSRNSFIEIQRIPGGQIANSSTVLVDYRTNQVGSYEYSSDNNTITTRVSLFNNLLELNYSHSEQVYTETESTGLVTLNPFKHDVLSANINYKFIGLGAKYDDYRSVIVPYNKLDYFLRLSGKIRNKIMMSVYGNLGYMTFSDINNKQIFSNANGLIKYSINKTSKINLDVNYRKQISEQINLEFINSNVEYTTQFRNLYINIGVEIYRRVYTGTETDFKGVYFKIDRRF